MADRICSDPTCDLPSHARGLCKKHHAKANYHANKAARQAQQATYRERHRAEARQRAAQWRADNPEQAREVSRRWYAEHAGQVLEYRRTYRAANLAEVLAHNKKRRALQRGAQVCDLTAEQWRQIKVIFDNRCAYCGRQMQRLTQDHLIPLARGGNHTASNVVPACQSCNSRKGDRPAPPFHPMLRHLE